MRGVSRQSWSSKLVFMYTGSEPAKIAIPDSQPYDLKHLSNQLWGRYCWIIS